MLPPRLSWQKSAILSSVLILLSSADRTGADPVRAGWTETINFPRVGIQLPAKLDTGAKTSALDARNQVRFSRSGQPWIRFTLPLASGSSPTIERPVLRNAKIKRAGAPTQTRPVVELQICVAGLSGLAQFTLNDRDGMAYPVLLGRRFLAGRVLVDPGARDLAAGKCAE